jgi:acetyl esterase/lipase
MASEESKLIRATFINQAESASAPLETQRREWEQAAAQAQLPPGTGVQPLVADGVSCERVSCAGADAEKVLLFLHGGGFSTGSCRTHRDLAARLSLATAVSVVLVDYGLVPECPFPAAIEDTARVYRWLIRTGTAPEKIAFGGDSAGGGLAVSTLLFLRERGEPMPAAVVLLSAWLDLALAGESLTSRAQVDPLTSREELLAAARLYAGDEEPRNPLLSPVYADLHGLPSMLIQVGDHEILLSDSIRLAERARAAGVEVQLEIWPEMWHVWQAWAASLPEGQAALDQIGRYIHQRLCDPTKEASDPTRR